MRPDLASPLVSPGAFIDWLMTRVVVTPDGCWLWEGADSGGGDQTRGAGYAKIKIAGKTFYVHRIAFQICVGKIASHLQIDHKCKHWFATDRQTALIYRRCVNPDHLEAVTQSDNLKRNSFACQGDFHV